MQFFTSSINQYAIRWACKVQQASSRNITDRQDRTLYKIETAFVCYKFSKDRKHSKWSKCARWRHSLHLRPFLVDEEGFDVVSVTFQLHALVARARIPYSNNPLRRPGREYSARVVHRHTVDRVLASVHIRSWWMTYIAVRHQSLITIPHTREERLLPNTRLHAIRRRINSYRVTLYTALHGISNVMFYNHWMRKRAGFDENLPGLSFTTPLENSLDTCQANKPGLSAQHTTGIDVRWSENILRLKTMCEPIADVDSNYNVCLYASRE